MNKQTQTLAGLGVTAASILAIALGRSAGIGFINAGASNDQDTRMRNLTAAAAADLEKQTPIKVDDIATIISVVSADKSITYSERLNVNSKDFDLVLSKNSYKDQHVKMTCSLPKTLRLISAGASYNYIYSDIDGAFMFQITIDKSDLKRCN